MQAERSTPKWVWAVGAGVVLVGLVRLMSCGKRTESVQVGVVCTSCTFRGPTPVRVGKVDWPVKCPKCGKRAAYVAFLCPKCRKSSPLDPKSPPTTCPHCNAAITDEPEEESGELP